VPGPLQRPARIQGSLPLTCNNPATEPPHTHDLSPVPPINSHFRPAFFAAPIGRPQLLHPRTRVLGNADCAASDLAGIEFRVVKVHPHGRDSHGVGFDAHLEATMHVGGHLQPRSRRRCACSGLADKRELREAVTYALQLQQGGKYDVHVGLATPGLVQTSHVVWAQHTHGDLLRDDGFAPPSPEAAIKRRVEVVVIGRARGGEGGVCVRRRRGHDSEGEQRHVVLFREADLGRRCIYGRLERAVEGGERHFEVDDIVCGGLDRIRLEDGILRVALTLSRREAWTNAAYNRQDTGCGQ
jgi:hypothetical protein